MGYVLSLDPHSRMKYEQSHNILMNMPPPGEKGTSGGDKQARDGAMRTSELIPPTPMSVGSGGGRQSQANYGAQSMAMGMGRPTETGNVVPPGGRAIAGLKPGEYCIYPEERDPILLSYPGLKIMYTSGNHLFKNIFLIVKNDFDEELKPNDHMINANTWIAKVGQYVRD